MAQDRDFTSIMGIISSIAAGGAITVGSGGTLVAGGIAISAAGYTAGAVTVAYGVNVVSFSSGNFKSDYARIQKIKNNPYYKKGKPSGVDELRDIEVRIDPPEPITSESFKDFLRANGENPNSWRKICETWAKPDGTIIERHYWSNLKGTKFYYHN